MARQTGRLHPGLVAILVLGVGWVYADFVEVRRPATVKRNPHRNASIIEHVDEGVRLPLLDDDQDNGYYNVPAPTTGEPGWIYRTLVRRHPGQIPAPVEPPVIPVVALGGPFQVHFLDVGTGDSAIIDMGTREIVIDGGDSIRVLHDYAADTGIIDDPIELVVVTHADFDHWNGLQRLLGFEDGATQSHTFVEFWEPGYDRDCRRLDSYDDFIDDIRNVAGVVFQRPLENFHTPAVDSGVPTPFTHTSLPGVTFTVLHSERDPQATDCAYRINNASIVLKIEIAGFSFLFTGDANGKERDDAASVQAGHVEARLLALETAHPGALRADVLKVPHHGSETASTQAFIDAVDPTFAIISASTKHHLPRDTVIERYDDGQRIILSTDEIRTNDNDHVICRVDEDGALDCNFFDVLGE